LFAATTIYAQPTIQWQKCLGGSYIDGATSIQTTGDGGYIIAGSTYSNDGDVSGNHGNRDAWVVKLTSIGSIQWQKYLGGTNPDEASSIQSTSDGGYILAGSTFSIDGDVLGNHGAADAWVVKLSSQGAIQWQKCLGGTDIDFGHCIQSTIDGGYIIAGETYSNDGDVSGNHGHDDVWVVKLNAPTVTSEIQDNKNWTLFPNPTSGSLEIKMNDNNPVVLVSVTDLLGRHLLEQKVISPGNIDLCNLPIGIYVVSALSEAGKIYQKKIVKE
jgi:hypothetical protein